MAATVLVATVAVKVGMVVAEPAAEPGGGMAAAGEVAEAMEVAAMAVVETASTPAPKRRGRTGRQARPLNWTRRSPVCCAHRRIGQHRVVLSSAKSACSSAREAPPADAHSVRPAQGRGGIGTGTAPPGLAELGTGRDRSLYRVHVVIHSKLQAEVRAVDLVVRNGEWQREVPVAHVRREGRAVPEPRVPWLWLGPEDVRRRVAAFPRGHTGAQIGD